MVRIKVEKPKVHKSVALHIKAITTAFKEAISPGTITIHYPRERRKLPDNFRGLLQLDKEKCINCFRCAHICPANAIQMYQRENKYYPGIDYTKCILCHFCVDSCPTAALKPSKIHDVAFASLSTMVLPPEELAGEPEMWREDTVTVEYDFDGDLKMIKRKEVENLIVEVEKPKRPEFVAGAAFPENCIACRICVNSCPQNAITFKLQDLQTMVLEIDFEKCTGCMVCIRNCPTQTLLPFRREEVLKGGESDEQG